MTRSGAPEGATSADLAGQRSATEGSSHVRRDRVSVEQSGPAARALIVAATTADGFGPVALRVVLVVIELTATWRRLSDQVSRAQIATRATCTEKTVTRTLARLEQLGLIVWHPARARGQLGTLSLVEPTNEPPKGLAITRDMWMSRVQPQNSGHLNVSGHYEPGTSGARTRDIERSNPGHRGVPLPTRDPDDPAIDLKFQPEERQRGKQGARNILASLRGSETETSTQISDADLLRRELGATPIEVGT